MIFHRQTTIRYQLEFATATQLAKQLSILHYQHIIGLLNTHTLVLIIMNYLIDTKLN